jgi:hypothetical protein
MSDTYTETTRTDWSIRIAASIKGIGAGIGQSELDASAMIEYFAPLQRWLAEKNKGEQCGW